ncbi:MAG: phosphatase PAP2 family protein [Solirubrobacterales bacterium]
MRHLRRSRSPLKPLVRAGALAALAGAFVVPLARRRLRVPTPLTVVAVGIAPAALAVLRPRTKGRDAAMFALQMWAFTVVHELPYDNPERLRGRLKVGYPIRADRVLGAGRLPSIRLQEALSRPGEVRPLDRVLAAAHWAWFMEPHLALAWILRRHDDRFVRAAGQMAATFDLGCAAYFAIPTAPPWWAAEHGAMDDQPTGQPGAGSPSLAVRRVMVEVGERTWGRAWPRLYQSLGGNPWAAMPSLHFGTSLLAAKLLAETGPVAGAAGWAYALTLGFALVYLGEHYAVDLVAGAALVALVRRAEPLAQPAAVAVGELTTRLERIANG